MKNIIQLMILVAAVLLVTGCAGKQSSYVMPSNQIELSDEVSESFYFKIRDPGMQKILAEIRMDELSRPQRMEVVILKHLVRAESEKDLKRVFDSLWETDEEFRKLVQFPERNHGFYKSQALIYYLLTIEPESWKIEIADRMYSKVLRRVKPGQLSGYTLHFYTYALLKKGMWVPALSFLDELKTYTTVDVFYQDQLMALHLFAGGSNLQNSFSLMNRICQDWQGKSEEFPANEIEGAIRVFALAGISGEERKAIEQLVKNCPDAMQVEFVSQLIQPSEIVVNQQVTHVVQGQSLQEGKILVKVQAVKAGQQLDYIDPAINNLKNELTNSFKYSYLDLVKEVALPFNLGEEQQVSLVGDYNLLIIFHSSDNDKYRIEVTLKHDRQELVHTFIESIDGGVATLGGPLEDGQTLLLRITTYNLASDII